MLNKLRVICYKTSSNKVVAARKSLKEKNTYYYAIGEDPKTATARLLTEPFMVDSVELLPSVVENTAQTRFIYV